MDDAYRSRVVALTGDPWCPYPDDEFMAAVLEEDDETARKMIEVRRMFMFPEFLSGRAQRASMNVRE